MAKADHIKKLIASFGRTQDFRAAALRIIDDAVQAHGGAGVSQDFGLAASWAGIRTLRLADGPDEVHNRAIARLEFAKHAPST